MTDALTISIPTLTTERLVLRAPDLADLPALEGFFTSEESHFVGGPLTENEVHRAFLSTVGHWSAYGYGLWHVADAKTNAFMGWIGLLLTAGRSEPGFAGAVLPAYQRTGVASEAGRAALTHYVENTAHKTPATFIEPANHRSLAAAQKHGFEVTEATDTLVTLRYSAEAAA